MTIKKVPRTVTKREARKLALGAATAAKLAWDKANGGEDVVRRLLIDCAKMIRSLSEDSP